MPVATPRTFVSRRAMVYGATGLIGRALLAQLLSDDRYAEVHALVRRKPVGWPDSTRLATHQVDFTRDVETSPEPLPVVDDVYCCIGTTIAAAGSQAAFRAVDHDLVVNTARAARRRGAERLAVVSAMGANPHAGVFYSRVKGEMELAVTQLGYPCVVIARPSLLAGDRGATGQPARPAERVALMLATPLARLLPARLRPIAAARVAAALRRATADGESGVRILDSADLQRLGD